jgi:protein-tyrosine phosphatase
VSGAARSGAPRAAVDLHCHILPGLDDGARDYADAVAMAEQAQADGMFAVCATPHIRADHDVSIPELAERVSALNGILRERGCAVRVLRGGEVACSALPGLTDDELRAVALGAGGRWILLEPDPGPLDSRLDEAVAELDRRGFRSVIAHPERHGAPDLAERLRGIVRRGALVQATAAYLTDADAGPAMLKLAGAGLIHVLGSDSHSSHAGRPVALSPALGVLATVPRVAPALRWVAVTAPQAIVTGRDVVAPF